MSEIICLVLFTVFATVVIGACHQISEWICPAPTPEECPGHEWWNPTLLGGGEKPVRCMHCKVRLQDVEGGRDE